MATDGTKKDDIDKCLHSTQQKEGPKTAAFIDNPEALSPDKTPGVHENSLNNGDGSAEPTLSEWGKKLLDIHNSSEETLRSHFEAIQSVFKKSANTSAEFVQKVGSNN